MSSRIQQFTTGNGYKFAYRLVSPLLMQKVQTSHPAPPPPLQEVKNADGSTRLEPNPDAPGYAADLAAHALRINEITRSRVIRLSVVPWQMTDEEKERIAEIRAEFGDEISNETDLEIYIGYEALSEVADYREFLQSATKGGPTDPKLPAGEMPTTSGLTASLPADTSHQNQG